MNIVFVGDWIKVNNVWSQVLDIVQNDLICYSCMIDADSPLIQKILSDGEFQKILEDV